MKSTVRAYLSRRHYSEMALDSKRRSVSSDQMVKMSVMEKQVSPSNSVTFTCCVYDPSKVEQQFISLKNWIGGMEDNRIRQEFISLLCPLLSHLYLEMICRSHRQSATDFLECQRALFASSVQDRKLLKHLLTISCSEDIERNSYIKSFTYSKFGLKLSTNAILILQKYLIAHGHIVILHTLQKWFDTFIENSDVVEAEEKEEGGDEILQEETVDQKSHAKLTVKTKYGMDSIMWPKKERSEFDRIKKIIQEVREMPASPGPMLLYRMHNVLHNVRVSRCKVNGNVKLLAVGVDSSVKLWSLASTLKSPSDVNVFDCSSHSTAVLDKHHVTMHGHTNSVQDVAFVRASKFPPMLLSVSQDATMRNWNLDNFQCVSCYRGHNNVIWSVDVSSLGIFAVTGSRDTTVRLWTLERNFPIRTCVGHQLDVECTKFHPNNMYFASGSSDKTVRLWSVNDAKLLRLFNGHKAPVQSLAFSPDGKYLASGSEDKRIRIWDLAAGKMFREFKGHKGSVVSLCWDRTSECISSGCSDGTVRQWSLNDTEESNDKASRNVLRMFDLGSGVLHVQHSLLNTLVCVVVS